MNKTSKALDKLADILIGATFTIVITCIIIAISLLIVKQYGGYDEKIKPDNELVDVSDIIKERDTNSASDNATK